MRNHLVMKHSNGELPKKKQMIFPLTSKGLPSAGVSPGDAKDALTP